MADFQAWKNGALGRHIDVDGSYGAQCVDVAMDYAQFVFPGHGWPELLGWGNAKDLFGAANGDFFDKIANDHNDPTQLPNQGDIIVYDQTTTNPYGHIAVVDAADSGGVNEVEQNGFNPDGACYEIYRVWSRSPCIGWLRPKDLSPPSPAPEVAPEPAPPVPSTDNAPEPAPAPSTEPTTPTPQPEPTPTPPPILPAPGSVVPPSNPPAAPALPSPAHPHGRWAKFFSSLKSFWEILIGAKQ